LPRWTGLSLACRAQAACEQARAVRPLAHPSTRSIVLGKTADSSLALGYWDSGFLILRREATLIRDHTRRVAARHAAAAAAGDKAWSLDA
jgi:hypothetical protein